MVVSFLAGYCVDIISAPDRSHHFLLPTVRPKLGMILASVAAQRATRKLSSVWAFVVFFFFIFLFLAIMAYIVTRHELIFQSTDALSYVLCRVQLTDKHGWDHNRLSWDAGSNSKILFPNSYATIVSK